MKLDLFTRLLFCLLPWKSYRWFAVRRYWGWEVEAYEGRPAPELTSCGAYTRKRAQSVAEYCNKYLL